MTHFSTDDDNYYPLMTLNNGFPTFSTGRRSSNSSSHGINISIEVPVSGQPYTPGLPSDGTSINSISPSTPEGGQNTQIGVVTPNGHLQLPSPLWQQNKATSSAPTSPSGDFLNQTRLDLAKFESHFNDQARRQSSSTSNVPNAQTDITRSSHTPSGLRTAHVHLYSASLSDSQPPMIGAQDLDIWQGGAPISSSPLDISSPLSLTSHESFSPISSQSSVALQSPAGPVSQTFPSPYRNPPLTSVNLDGAGIQNFMDSTYNSYPFPSYFNAYHPSSAPAMMETFPAQNGMPALTDPTTMIGDYTPDVPMDSLSDYPQPGAEGFPNAQFFPPTCDTYSNNIPTSVDPHTLSPSYPSTLVAGNTSAHAGPSSALPSIPQPVHAKVRPDEDTRKEAVYEILIESQDAEKAAHAVCALSRRENDRSYIDQFKKAMDHHPKESAPGKAKAHERRKRDPRFQCILCSDRMTTNNNLQNHYRSHLALRKFRCKYCNVSFATESIRARHYRNTVKCPGYNSEHGVQQSRSTYHEDHHGHGQMGFVAQQNAGTFFTASRPS